MCGETYLHLQNMNCKRKLENAVLQHGKLALFRGIEDSLFVSTTLQALHKNYFAITAKHCFCSLLMEHKVASF